MPKDIDPKLVMVWTEVSLRSPYISALDALASEEGVDRSVIVERAIVSYLFRHRPIPQYDEDESLYDRE